MIINYSKKGLDRVGCTALILIIFGLSWSASGEPEQSDEAKPAVAETVFPDKVQDEEMDGEKSAQDAKEWQAVLQAVKVMDKRLEAIEKRLGFDRRPPTVTTTVERRLAEIERRLDGVERQLQTMRQMEQRLRRLEGRP